MATRSQHHCFASLHKTSVSKPMPMPSQSSFQQPSQCQFCASAYAEIVGLGVAQSRTSWGKQGHLPFCLSSSVAAQHWRDVCFIRPASVCVCCKIHWRSLAELGQTGTSTFLSPGPRSGTVPHELGQTGTSTFLPQQFGCCTAQLKRLRGVTSAIDA